MILFEALVTFAHPVIGEHFQIIIHLHVLRAVPSFSNLIILTGLEGG